MRWLLNDLFEQNLKLLSNENVQIDRALFFSGGENEPEIETFKTLFPLSEISLFGIQGNDVIFFDLNQKNIHNFQFDLVCCNQVIEHLWNHSAAFDNLASLVKDSGYLWITLPFLNFPHGEPKSFVSGVSNIYLERNFSQREFIALSSGIFGSKRYYTSSLFFLKWLEENEHRRGLFGVKIFKGRSPKYALYHFIRFDFIRFLLITFLSKSLNSRWATETFYFGKKRPTNENDNLLK